MLMKPQELVEKAEEVLKLKFQLGRHHVAVALYANSKIYTSVHLDTKGFDVCAEPIAIHDALKDGSNINQMVAVIKNGSAYEVVSPCDNCRQLLLDLVPEVNVIIKGEDELLLMKPIELLPYPY